MARTVMLIRHTDNDGDALTPEGVAAAVDLGRRLCGPWDLCVSSGAHRATQTIGCILGAAGAVSAGGIVVEAGLRSTDEDRWRAAYGAAQSGALDALRVADPEFVDAECAALAVGLRAVFDRLGDGGQALAVGHSPTNEAAVRGLTGVTVGPLGKGEGVRVVDHGGTYGVS